MRSRISKFVRVQAPRWRTPRRFEFIRTDKFAVLVPYVSFKIFGYILYRAVDVSRFPPSKIFHTSPLGGHKRARLSHKSHNREGPQVKQAGTKSTCAGCTVGFGYLLFRVVPWSIVREMKG